MQEISSSVATALLVSSLLLLTSCVSSPGTLNMDAAVEKPLIELEAIYSADKNFIYQPPKPTNSIKMMKNAATFYPFPGLNPDNTRKVAKITEDVYKITPWPQAGYNYDYYIYIPRTYSERSPRRLLAISIASGGEQGRGVEYYSDWARKVVVKGNWETKLADGLGIPLVYPAFERPLTPAVQYLTSDGMTIKGERFSRLDLQYISMIDDARAFLASEKGMLLDEKVLLAGYSMSGKFAERFTLMHPDRVKAATYGGLSSAHILPFTTDLKMKRSLIYPIGVADIEEISGVSFNRDAYLAVPIFYFEGALDPNDTTRFNGLFPSSFVDWIDARMGKAIEQRWLAYDSLLHDAGLTIKMMRYPDLTHAVNTVDMINFLREHVD